MNYRHHYHAGNYADVFKHVLLLQLVRAMQRKEKGFLYLDTHAGRGRLRPERDDDPARRTGAEPEWPDGIGRLWEAAEFARLAGDYLAAVRRFNARQARRNQR